MSRSAASVGSARVAIVGAASPQGAALREELAGARVPGERVDLFGPHLGEDGEAVLSEYDGEARLIQEPDANDIVTRDVIFLCERSALAHQVAQRAAAPAVVIDLVGCLNDGSRPIHLELNPQALKPEAPTVRVADPLAMMLAELLHPFDRDIGLSEVVAVVLRPASDFGERGVDELREQVTRLLNFASVPVETFGRQLAFNLLRQGHVEPDQPELESRIAGEVGALLGWDDSRITLRCITAPIFFGHCIQLRFRTGEASDLADLQQIIDDGPFQSSAEPGTTPLEQADASGLTLAPPSRDGLGGFWLWAVVGEAPRRGAAQAVRIARSVADL